MPSITWTTSVYTCPELADCLDALRDGQVPSLTRVRFEPATGDGTRSADTIQRRSAD